MHTLEKVTEGWRKLHVEDLYLYFCLLSIVWGDQIKYDYMGRTRNTRWRIKQLDSICQKILNGKTICKAQAQVEI